jgi:hypothetical protein
VGAEGVEVADDALGLEELQPAAATRTSTRMPATVGA